MGLGAGELRAIGQSGMANNAAFAGNFVNKLMTADKGDNGQVDGSLFNAASFNNPNKVNSDYTNLVNLMSSTATDAEKQTAEKNFVNEITDSNNLKDGQPAVKAQIKMSQDELQTYYDDYKKDHHETNEQAKNDTALKNFLDSMDDGTLNNSIDDFWSSLTSQSSTDTSNNTDTTNSNNTSSNVDSTDSSNTNNFGSLTSKSASATTSSSSANSEGKFETKLDTQFQKNVLDDARKYVGYNEADGSSQIFNRASGLSSSDPWCAAFVHYVYKEANGGKEAMQGCQNVNNCPDIDKWAQDNKISTHDVNQVKAGDAILFDWNGDGTADHVGIVTKIENGRVYTIEGNSSNKVVDTSISPRNGYDINSSCIKSYVQMHEKITA